MAGASLTSSFDVEILEKRKRKLTERHDEIVSDMELFAKSRDRAISYVKIIAKIDIINDRLKFIKENPNADFKAMEERDKKSTISLRRLWQSPYSDITTL